LPSQTLQSWQLPLASDLQVANDAELNNPLTWGYGAISNESQLDFLTRQLQRQTVPQWEREAIQERARALEQDITPAQLHRDFGIESVNMVSPTNRREIAVPRTITGTVDGQTRTLSPQTNWFSFEGTSTQATDAQGRYRVVVGPRVLDPYYADDRQVWQEHFSFPIAMNAVLVNRNTGERRILELITESGAKAHTFNAYGNTASFDAENGIFQTGIAYPNSWNFANEISFARNHIDGSSIEFVVGNRNALGFNPNDYTLERIIVLD
jgi:hypothetical protein